MNPIALRVQAKLESLYSEVQGMPLVEFETVLRRLVITRALDAAGWNVCAAARALGIHPNVMTARMQRLNIKRPAHLSRHGVLPGLRRKDRAA